MSDTRPKLIYSYSLVNMVECTEFDDRSPRDYYDGHSLILGCPDS